ncbi:hypothetical protein [Polymorphospora rubra]|uniref:hypothetical protein n=1 Tax=Polymorphospora rubra TaxID=338584 RepID=UPI0033EC4D26
MRPSAEPPFAEVESGMRVVDATGAEIGRVAVSRPGDPNAVTVQAPPDGPGDALSEVSTPATPDVPPDAAARLLRAGYLRVDGTPDHYVAADQIAEVTGDVVLLKVRTDQLTSGR